MTDQGTTAEAVVNHEQRLYRREAIDFQRYRFIGEPLRTGRATLLPVVVALAALALGIAGLAIVSHRPGLRGRIVARDARSLSVLLDERHSTTSINRGDVAALAGHTPGERDARVVTAKARMDGRAVVRLAFAPGPALALVPGERVLLRLPPRPLPLIP